MMNAHEYKRKVFRRTLKRCLITAIVMAMPGIILCIFNRWLLLFALSALIPVIYLADKICMILTWDLAEGIIADVTLYNDFDQPCTEAHIQFQTENRSAHECVFTIGHYGDYEEGIEPELEIMLQKDKALFMGKRIPVFHSPKDAGKCVVYLEDALGSSQA